MSVLSKGEVRVRTQFNVAEDKQQHDDVSVIKLKSAMLINHVEELSPEGRADGEFARLKSLAQTAYEEAAMWAVKAATYKP